MRLRQPSVSPARLLLWVPPLPRTATTPPRKNRRRPWQPARRQGTEPRQRRRCSGRKKRRQQKAEAEQSGKGASSWDARPQNQTDGRRRRHSRCRAAFSAALSRSGAFNGKHLSEYSMERPTEDGTFERTFDGNRWNSRREVPIKQLTPRLALMLCATGLGPPSDKTSGVGTVHQQMLPTSDVVTSIIAQYTGTCCHTCAARQGWVGGRVLGWVFPSLGRGIWGSFHKKSLGSCACAGHLGGVYCIKADTRKPPRAPPLAACTPPPTPASVFARWC